MSEEKALVPVEQKDIDFCGDEITVVLVELDERKQVFIPIRSICDYLGLSWAGQRQRIHRDEILAEVSSECVIHSQGQRRTMLCLPLDYLNGWLFGISASRVNPEVKDNLLRYQRECYRVLADAFLPPALIVRPVDADDQALVQLHNMALVIAATTREMLEIKQLAMNNKTRLDAAREYLQGMNQRLKITEQKAQLAEQRTRAGTLTEEQAREIQYRVNLISHALTKHKPGEKHHMSVYETLRHQTGATSYKSIPMKGYEAAIDFLDNWLLAIQQAEQH
jgi:ribosomal protein S13